MDSKANYDLIAENVNRAYYDDKLRDWFRLLKGFDKDVPFRDFRKDFYFWIFDTISHDPNVRTKIQDAINKHREHTKKIIEVTTRIIKTERITQPQPELAAEENKKLKDPHKKILDHPAFPLLKNFAQEIATGFQKAGAEVDFDYIYSQAAYAVQQGNGDVGLGIQYYKEANGLGSQKTD